VITRTARLPLAIQLLLRFRNPLLLLLVAASIVLGFTGDVASMAIILLVLLASVTLDFVQEHRANRAVERLQATIAATVSVRRDAAMRSLSIADIVAGDVVALQAGDVVPADGRVLEATGLVVDESALTGESFPVEKATHAGPERFRTGWFVESMATQVLVVFVIRTRRNSLASRPHPLLAATSIAVVALALALPYLPFADLLGFVPLPLPFLAMLLALVAVYLVLAQYARRAFLRWTAKRYAPRHALRVT